MVVVSLCIVPMHHSIDYKTNWFQKTFTEMLRGNFNAQNSSVASFSFYKTHSFHKTWNLFPLNLHSLPLHGCLPSPRSSTNLVPDVLAQGGGHLSFLVWKELTWLWSQSHSSPEAGQLSGHQLCDPAILSVCLLYFVFFLVATRRRVEMWRGRALHLCLPSEACWCCVLDDNTHRLKCLTYHDVCSMMGDHIQFGCCYMMTQVWVCVLHVLKHLLKPPLSW